MSRKTVYNNQRLPERTTTRTATPRRHNGNKAPRRRYDRDCNALIVLQRGLCLPGSTTDGSETPKMPHNQPATPRMHHNRDCNSQDAPQRTVRERSILGSPLFREGRSAFLFFFFLISCQGPGFLKSLILFLINCEFLVCEGPGWSFVPGERQYIRHVLLSQRGDAARP